MKCQFEDCFACPYDDCILSDTAPTGAKRGRKPLPPEERKAHRRAYQREYYQKHKEELKAKAHKRYLRSTYGQLPIFNDSRLGDAGPSAV